jgi:DNA-binding NtrC family response regulator
MTIRDGPTVFVIDDDDLGRAAIQDLLKSVGLEVDTFGTAQQFLCRKRPDGPSCLVLDVELPGVSGLDFQQDLASAGIAQTSSEVSRGEEQVSFGNSSARTNDARRNCRKISFTTLTVVR